MDDGIMMDWKNPLYLLCAGLSLGIALETRSRRDPSPKQWKSRTLQGLSALGIIAVFLVAPASAAVPAADFSANPTNGPVALDVAFTDNSTGSPTGWAWFFGDENYTGPWMEMKSENARWQARYYHSSVALPDDSIVLMGGWDGGSTYYNDTWRSTDKGVTWTLLNVSAGWPARSSHSSVALSDGSILLMGGWDGSGFYNDTWRSTDSGATWTEVNASGGWLKRDGHTSVALSDGSILLMGGWDGASCHNDTWMSTNNGATWTLMNASGGWLKRDAHTSVALSDGSIVLMGGWAGGNRNDVWRSTDHGATWTEVSPQSPGGWSVRYAASSVVLPGDIIVLMGGEGGGSYRNDTWISTDSGATWIQKTAGGEWPGRQGLTSVALSDGSIVLMGGWDGHAKNDVWRSVDGGVLWYDVSLRWSARAAHTSVALPDGSIVLMGGTDGSSLKSDTWRSTDKGATWTLMNASSGWSGRLSHSSVALSDGSIVLMGGIDTFGSNPHRNDAWRSTDKGATWTLMNASSGWSGRLYHTSVALPDGSIVLMGGYHYSDSDGAITYNDVWRSTDHGATWTLINASAGWSPRTGHSSVALPDGSILLTGGNSYGDRKNDTWRSTDKGVSWTLMNASPGWSGRSYHTSVSLPDNSIVLMGGNSNPGRMNDVWRSTDNGSSWSLVNASAGWSPRSEFTSVTVPDGSVVLMGGNEGITHYNDVWRFQPAGSSLKDPSHQYTRPGTYPVALQVFNTDGFDSTRKAGYITVTSDLFASFTATPEFGTAPLGVQFTDTSSGVPTSWQWNFGDGSANATIRNPFHTYTLPGQYNVTLTVRNAEGWNSTLTRPDLVQATTWQSEVVAPAPGYKLECSLALNASGLPCISYWNGDHSNPGVPSGNLTYAWKDSAGWHTEVVDAEPGAGRYNSLALDAAGWPHISYYDWDGLNTGCLKYAWKNATGWHTLLIEPDTGIWGSYTSIALDANSWPQISFWGGTNDLMCASEDETGWGIDYPNPTLVGRGTSIALTPDGLPRISALAGTDGEILKLCYLSMDSTYHWTTEVVETQQDRGDGSSLALAPDGSPCISYYGDSHVNPTELVYTHKNASGWSRTVVDPSAEHSIAGGSADKTSLALNATGWPRIGYMGGKNYNISVKFAWQDPDGWHTEVVDHSGTGYGSLALNRLGSPRMSYRDGPNQTLKYAWKGPDPLAGPSITSISPDNGIAGKSVFTTIMGANFSSSANTKVNLTYGGVNIVGTGVTVTGGTKIICSFLLPAGAAPVPWDLVVTNTTSGASGIKMNAFRIYSSATPTISFVTPTSGLRNLTIPFSLSGTNFPAGSVVTFTNSTYGTLTAVLSSVVANKITGNLTIPPGVPEGKWDVVVTVPDGRNATKTGAFTVNAWKKPVVSSITPTSGYRNATLSFSLSGTNFQADALVNFTNATYGNVTATLGSVSLTKITGTVFFPPGAPAGKWDLSVATPDGGQSLPRTGAFVVNPWKVPTISSLSPKSGLLNTTTAFTLSGTGFQPGAVVNFTNATYPGGNLTTAITVVSPAKITGTLLIPYNAPTGKWNVIITTPDGGQSVPKTGAFTVKDWSKPTISSINQTKGVHGTTINYAIAGTSFQPGSTVTFTNTSGVGLNFTAAVTITIPAKITGSVTIPVDRIGKYGIEVICPDGKRASKANAFTVT